MSIADELQLLISTKEQIRLAVGASKTVPFSAYVDLIDGNPVPQVTVDPVLIGIERQTAILANTKESLRVAIGLSTSIPFSQYASYLISWDPSELFKNGEQGAWYDPSDLSTLFQDAAGTTPVTATGEPVGLMLDKSGNGNHATQSVVARRPVYRTDGAVHWLAFDGIDDFLVATGFSWLSAADLSTRALVGLGFQRDSGLGYVIHGAGGVATSSSRFGYLSGEGGFDRFRIGIDNNYPSNTAARIYTATYSRPDLEGAASLNGSNAAPLLVVNGTGASDAITIGCRTPTRPAAHFTGRLLGIVISEQYSVSKMQQVNSYMANKSGVAL